VWCARFIVLRIAAPASSLLAHLDDGAQDRLSRVQDRLVGKPQNAIAARRKPNIALAIIFGARIMRATVRFDDE
jgi:hypothetical protein